MVSFKSDKFLVCRFKDWLNWQIAAGSKKLNRTVRKMLNSVKIRTSLLGQNYRMLENKYARLLWQRKVLNYIGSGAKSRSRNWTIPQTKPSETFACLPLENCWKMTLILLQRKNRQTMKKRDIFLNNFIFGIKMILRCCCSGFSFWLPRLAHTHTHTHRARHPQPFGLCETMLSRRPMLLGHATSHRPLATCRSSLELPITFADVERADSTAATHIKFIFMCMHARCLAFPLNFVHEYPVNHAVAENEFVASLLPLISAWNHFPNGLYSPPRFICAGYLAGDYSSIFFLFLFFWFLSSVD